MKESTLLWLRNQYAHFSSALWISHFVLTRRGWLARLTIFIFASSASCTTLPPQKEPLTLVFKHPRLLSREESLGALLDEFRHTHSSVRLREEVLPSSSDEQHLFYVTNLESGAAEFDVFALDIIWVPEFRRAGWLQELTPHVSPGNLDDFPPASLEAALFNERLYAVSWFADAGVLYYRKDLLDRYGCTPPRTINEMRTIAQHILHHEHNPALTGFVWQGKQYEGLLCVALEFLRAYGGEIMDRHGQSLLTSPATVTGLSALRDTISESGVSPSSVTTADEETVRHLFAGGKAIFMRNWPYAWSLLNAEDSPLRGRVGVASVPGSPDHSGVPTLGGWHLGVNRFSRHPQMAWELIAFLTSAESQRRLATAGGLKPTRVSVYHDAQAQREDPSLALFFPFLRSARPRPVSPFYLMLSQVLQGEFSAAITGIKPVNVALYDAERQMHQLLALDAWEEAHAQNVQ
jgi:multiple sugar transport system substrate-binding protein